jgi:hypothetical protein
MRAAGRTRKSRRQPGRRSNPVVRAAILEAVENQLRDDDPPEVQFTLKRLVDSGLSDHSARLYIGMALLFEMHEVTRTNTPFDHDRYVAYLNRLPNLS